MSPSPTNDSSGSIGGSAQSAPAMLSAGRRRERYERDYDRVYLPSNTNRGESSTGGAPSGTERAELGETDACKQLVNYPRYLQTRVSRASRGTHSTTALTSASYHGGDAAAAPSFQRSKTEEVNAGKIRTRYRDTGLQTSGIPGLTPSAGLRRSNTNERSPGRRKKDPLVLGGDEANMPGAFNCVPLDDESQDFSVQSHQSPQLFVGVTSSSNATRRTPGLRRGRPGHQRTTSHDTSNLPMPDDNSSLSNHDDELSASQRSQRSGKHPAPFRRVRTVQGPLSSSQPEYPGDRGDDRSVGSHGSQKIVAPFRRVRTVQDPLSLSQGEHGDESSVSSQGPRKNSAPFRRVRTAQDQLPTRQAQQPQIVGYYAPRHDRDSTSPTTRPKQSLNSLPTPPGYRRTSTAPSSFSPARSAMGDEEVDLSLTLPPLLATSRHSPARNGSEDVDLSDSLSTLNSGVIIPDRASSRSPERGSAPRRLSQAERELEAPSRHGRGPPHRTSVTSSNFASALGVTDNEDEDLSLILQSLGLVDSVLNDSSREAQGPSLTEKEDEDLKLLLQTLDKDDSDRKERPFESRSGKARSSAVLPAVLCGTENIDEDTSWIFQSVEHKNNTPTPSKAHHRSQSVGAVAATTGPKIAMPRPSIIRKARSEGTAKVVKKSDTPLPSVKSTPLPPVKPFPLDPSKLMTLDQSNTETETTTIFESSQEYSDASLRPTLAQSPSPNNLSARSKNLLASKQSSSALSVYDNPTNVSPTSLVSRLLLKTIGKPKLFPNKRKQQKQASKTNENPKNKLRNKKKVNKRMWLERSKKDSQRLSRAHLMDAVED